MRKSAALLGPGTGPAVRLARANARVQVRGIREEEHAVILQRCSIEGETEIHAPEDGEYPLAECDFVEVTYEGRNRNFIACVLIGG